MLSKFPTTLVLLCLLSSPISVESRRPFENPRDKISVESRRPFENPRDKEWNKRIENKIDALLSNAKTVKVSNDLLQTMTGAITFEKCKSPSITTANYANIAVGSSYTKNLGVNQPATCRVTQVDATPDGQQNCAPFRAAPNQVQWYFEVQSCSVKPKPKGCTSKVNCVVTAK